MVDKNPHSHPHYTHVDDEKQADAVAWAFLNPNDFVKFPFKFEEIGDNEVRANITHTGLCQSDSLHARGKWGGSRYPIAPGHEVVGVVSKLGKNVTDFKVGDRVAFGPFRDCCDKCIECLNGDDHLCRNVEGPKKGLYDEYWGGYATAIQQPAKYAFKLPENLPSDRTPPVLCAGVTVHAPLARFAKPGDKVAVIGIGGLGHMAVQYAAKFGCHVTAFSSTPEKEAEIKKLGAHEVVSSKDPEALAKHANTYNVIINTLAIADDKVFSLYLGLTASSGTFVQVGAPPVDQKMSLIAFELIIRNISFAGSLVGSRKETRACLEFSARHNILPICEFFEFDDFPKAFDTLENGRPKFRCVVNCENYAKAHGLSK